MSIDQTRRQAFTIAARRFVPIDEFRLSHFALSTCETYDISIPAEVLGSQHQNNLMTSFFFTLYTFNRNCSIAPPSETFFRVEKFLAKKVLAKILLRKRCCNWTTLSTRKVAWFINGTGFRKRMFWRKMMVRMIFVLFLQIMRKSIGSGLSDFFSYLNRDKPIISISTNIILSWFAIACLLINARKQFECCLNWK